MKIPNDSNKTNLISASPKDKKFHLQGLTITPGGFFAGEGVWRSRNEQADMGSTFVGIPLGNNPLYYMNELRLSARQSRASALVEGNLNNSIKLSGYGEVDFLGNGSANQIQTNSFDLRIRAFYAHLDQVDSGLHLLAGQNWSLATTNAHNFIGPTPQNEIVPPTIDAQYIVGFVWKRQPQFRITKDLSAHSWVAFSIENPQTTFAGIPSTGNGQTPIFDNIVVITSTASGNASLPSVTTFSLDHIPDIIGKLAFEPTLHNHKMHMEGVGMYRDFYNRVQYLGNQATNYNTKGWGIGGSGILEAIPALLDIQGNVLAGHGIGSYTSGQLPDVTIDSRGALAPIQELVFSIGATLHATKALDFYLFGGSEREQPKYFKAGNKYFGYGVPTANNTGCNLEGLGICAGAVRNLWQINAGLWNKLYTGIYGELRFGVQYSYTVKELFPGTNNGNTAIPLGYRTNENIVLASLRYFPFTGGTVVNK